MEIKKIPLKDLQQDPANARKHPEKNKKALAQSLKRFGAARSIVVDKNNVIRAGNGTIEAAAAAGIKDAVIVEADGNELVVVKRKGWSEAEAMAYALADNQLQASSEWDKDRLGFQLGALLAEGFEMDAIGFDKAELERLAKLPVLSNMDDDVAPEPPANPRTVPGDLYLLGKHRLLCGDSTKPADVERLLGGVTPLMMVTDPPYGVEYDPEWREEHDKFVGRRRGKVANDDRVDWSEAFKLFPGPVAYVWHAGVFAGDVALNLAQADLMIRAQIIWRKQHFVLSRGAYHWQHEPCWYAVRKGAKSFWVGDRSQSTVWDVANHNAMGGQKDDANTKHGTQKPLELFRRAIANHDRGDEKMVYDPFLGSGTCLIAAEQLGATCLGMEIDPAYCDVIVERWENITKQKANLA